jgi:hypothetical protein
MPKESREVGPVAETPEDEVLPEYEFTADDFRRGDRGKYAERYARGTNLVLLDSDVAELFPNSEAVNQALRALGEIIRSSARRSA